MGSLDWNLGTRASPSVCSVGTIESGGVPISCGGHAKKARRVGTPHRVRVACPHCVQAAPQQL